MTIQLQIDLTVIFTALALIISLITLWFSHLKGPDIELCNQPKTELKDWSEYELTQHLSGDYVPYYLGLEPIQLIFVNNGSRSGAITKIEAEFEPNKKFKQLYRDKHVSVRTEEKELPASIEAGGTRIVELSCDIRVIDWKQDFRFEEVKDISNLKEAIGKSIDLDRIRFGEFVNFLKSRETLGNLEIEMTCLGRRWFRTRTITKEIGKMEIKNNCKVLLEGFEKLLKNWDNVSAANKLLRRIPEILDQLIQKLQENSEKVQKEVKVGSFQGLDDLSDYWRRLGEQTRIIERIIFEREKELKTKLDELSQQIIAYNSKVVIISMGREDVKPEQIHTLDQERRKIEPTINEMLSKVRELRAKLIDEIG